MTFADSAGVPFEGRSFHANESAGDDGSADPRLIETVLRFHARELGLTEVVAALGPVRLLVPLLTDRGDEGDRRARPARRQDPGTRPRHPRRPRRPYRAAGVLVGRRDAGLEPDRAAHPGDGGPSGRRGGGRRARRDRARPRIADRTRPAPHGLRVAGGRVRPSSRASSMSGCSRRSSRRRRQSRRCGPCNSPPVIPTRGSPDPSSIVQLTLDAGLAQEELDAVISRLGDAWAASPVILDRVDSIAVRLESL